MNRRVVCDQLGVQETQTPSTYFGMPMSVGRRKTTLFSVLVDKVKKKLHTLQNQTFSKAGKVTLLKTVARAIPNFWMNMLLIPVEDCESLERKMNKIYSGEMEGWGKDLSLCHGSYCVRQKKQVG